MLVIVPFAVITEPALTPRVALILFIESSTTRLGPDGLAYTCSMRNAIGIVDNTRISSINTANLFFIFLSPFLLQTHLELYDLGGAIVLFQTAYKFCEI